MRKNLSRALLDLEVRNEKVTSQSAPQCILALDYGEKYTGVAYTPEGETILPMGVFETKRDLNQALKNFFTDKPIDFVVMGLPIGIHGEENHICEAIRAEAAKIENRFNCSVKMVNERYSSQKSLAKNKKERLDDLAAMNILEYFLTRKA